MAVKDASTLKSYFNLTKVPVPSNYVDLVDTIFAQGIGGDDHDHDDRYVQLIIPNNISAVHTFSPSTYSPPFILGSYAQSQTITGLKADQLNKSISVSGLGLSGGGALDDNRTITLASSSDPQNSASILATDTNGILTLLTLKTEVLQDQGITGSILINPTGGISLDPGGGNVLPVTNYEINLGSINKKYLTLHAAELWVDTLVAHETIATIGGRILIAPTTSLTRDLGNAEISFYVKHNQMLNGDRVYMESSGKVEWIAVGDDGVLQAEGDYKYRITRNLDGTGANDWFAGDAVLNTGTTNDGYIDIYSEHSIRGDTQYGPTIVGNIRTGAVYSNLIEGWAVGNLNGLYGYGVDTYGAAFGKYVLNSSYLTIDPDNGIQIIHKTNLAANITIAQWAINGDLTIGQVAASQDNIFISAGSLALRVNTTEYIKMTTAGVITVGVTSGPNTVIGSTGVQFKNSSTVNLDITSAGVITIGQVGVSQDNIYISSGALYFRVNTSNYISMTTAGIITVGATSGPNTVIASTGIQFKNSSTVTIDITSAGVVTIGGTSAGNVYISASGIAIRDASTTYINLDTSGNATFGRTGGAYANVYWNATDFTLQFRTNTTVKSYIDTDGAFVISAPTSYTRANAVVFETGGVDVAGYYGYSSASGHGLQLDVPAISNKFGYVDISARVVAANTTYYPTISLRAYRDTTEVAGIQLQGLNTGGVIYITALDVSIGPIGSRGGDIKLNVIGTDDIQYAAQWEITSDVSIFTIPASSAGGRLQISGGLYVGAVGITAEPGRIYTAKVETLAAGQSDDYAANLRLAPGYTGAYTVTRHNYISLINPTLAGSAVITDAAALHFPAAIGTHKAIDSGTTKASPGTVTAWMKVNLNGVIHYMPCYASKTS